MSEKTVIKEEAIKKFRAGDPVALAIIFHQFYLEVCFFARRMVDKPRAAEKIVQQSFIDLWELHGQFENWAAIKAFLYRQVREACFTQIRGGQAEKDEAFSVYDWREATQFMEKELSRPEEMKALPYDPVENLPPLLKEVYVRISNADSGGKGIISNSTVV